MKSGGASQVDIDFATKTQYSTEPNHVAFHRTYIEQYNPNDPWRQPNNFIMHPMNYQFGQGTSSPQYIGGMFGQLDQPVTLHGPQFGVHPSIAPHVVFQPW